MSPQILTGEYSRFGICLRIAVPELSSYQRPFRFILEMGFVDGIYTMTGGELPNQGRNTIHQPIRPGLLIAGMNCVCTDAVATAVMGFDPMADRGTLPFEKCDSTLRLAEELGVGTRDLARIEEVGTPIAKARYRSPTLTQLTT
jgi:hypothetical protein